VATLKSPAVLQDPDRGLGERERMERPHNVAFERIKRGDTRMVHKEMRGHALAVPNSGISKGEGRSRSDRVRQRVAKVESQRGGWAGFLNKGSIQMNRCGTYSRCTQGQLDVTGNNNNNVSSRRDHGE
jgi:hypothetical protein